MPEHVHLMDQVYRYTRHVYDLSRKYFLLGRDTLLTRLDVKPGERVLEVGCGTARNLICLAQRRRGLELFGLDASGAMLDTAELNLRRAQLKVPVTLSYSMAENLDYKMTFKQKEPFDAIFFSYSLSMIPTWSEALEAALHSLKPGRSLYIVDFWDQRDLPGWFRSGLVKFLKTYHVQYRPELLERLEAMQDEGKGTLTLEAIGRRYAYLAVFEKKR